jgi:hypothetical protein
MHVTLSDYNALNTSCYGNNNICDTGLSDFLTFALVVGTH